MVGSCMSALGREPAASKGHGGANRAVRLGLRGRCGPIGITWWDDPPPQPVRVPHLNELVAGAIERLMRGLMIRQPGNGGP